MELSEMKPIGQIDKPERKRKVQVYGGLPEGKVEEPKVEPEKPIVEEKKDSLPFYRKAGFKKLVGGTLSLVGGIVILYPHPAATYIGSGIAAIGAAILGVGTAHTVIKKTEGVDRSDSVWKSIFLWIKSLAKKK